MKQIPLQATPAFVFGLYTDTTSRLYFVWHMFSEQQLRECLDLHPGLQNKVTAAIKHRLHLIETDSESSN